MGFFGMGFLLHWVMLFGFWLVLSGIFDAFQLTAGVLCTGGVALVSRQMQLVDLGGGTRAARHVAATPWHRLLMYAIWLLREIAIANWQVVRIVLNPRLPINPALVRFRTRTVSDIGATILANSITLTPGTITVQVTEGELVIHALVDGEQVVNGVRAMQDQVIAALPRFETGAVSP